MLLKSTCTGRNHLKRLPMQQPFAKNANQRQLFQKLSLATLNLCEKTLESVGLALSLTSVRPRGIATIRSLKATWRETTTSELLQKHGRQALQCPSKRKPVHQLKE